MKVCVKFARENLWKIGLWKMYNGLLAFKGCNQQLEMLPTYVENLPNRWARMCCLCLWNIMEMIFCLFWSCVKKTPKLISWSFFCVHVLSFFKSFFMWASQQLVLTMQVGFCGVRKKKVCTMLLNKVAPIFKFYKLCWVKDKGTLGPHETKIWGGYNFYCVDVEHK